MFQQSSRVSVHRGNRELHVESLVRRFAKTAEIQLHPVQAGPLVQSLRRELRDIIHPDRSGQPVLLHQPLQDLHDSFSLDAGRHLDGQTLTSKVIHYR